MNFVLRLDENRHAGRITEELLSVVRAATLCVADSTGFNPNVMREIGLVMALNKPVIFLHGKDSEVPFDIQNMRATSYDRGSLTKILQGLLKEAAAATVAHYNLPTASRLGWIT